MDIQTTINTLKNFKGIYTTLYSELAVLQCKTKSNFVQKYDVVYVKLHNIVEL